ncbi:coiled-coil protein [Candidatus Hodarchaeum mangrovi]
MLEQDIESQLLKISNMEAIARDIKHQREGINRKVTEIANKRNSLNEQVKELIATAKEEREKRDNCNDKITALKENKTLLLKELEGFEKQAEGLNGQLEGLNVKGNTHSRRVDISAKKIRHEIQELEWKIQTTSNLSINEEREIVEQIARLEQKFREVRETDVISRDLRTFNNRINVLKGKMRSLENELRSMARESRFHHKTMIQAFKNADVMRKQADDLHAQFIDAKKQANSVHNEYLNYLREINRIRQDINKSKQKVRAKQDAHRKEKLEEKTEDARKKFEEGRKLSFEEFRTLIDKGLI